MGFGRSEQTSEPFAGRQGGTDAEAWRHYELGRALVPSPRGQGQRAVRPSCQSTLQSQRFFFLAFPPSSPTRSRTVSLQLGRGRESRRRNQRGEWAEAGDRGRRGREGGRAHAPDESLEGLAHALAREGGRLHVDCPIAGSDLLGHVLAHTEPGRVGVLAARPELVWAWEGCPGVRHSRPGPSCCPRG